MNEIFRYCHWLYFSSMIQSFGQGELLQLSVSLEKIDIVQIVEEALLVDMCQALYFMIMLREPAPATTSNWHYEDLTVLGKVIHPNYYKKAAQHSHLSR